MRKLLCLLVLMSFSATSEAKMVVGKVDVQRVLLTVNEGKAVRSRLKKRFDIKKKELKKEESKIKKLQKEFQKNSMIFADKVKMKKQTEIQKMIMAFQNKTMAYQKEIQSLEQKLKKPILERIEKIIKVVSKKAKVDVTFEISTTPIIYAQVEKDLTKSVIDTYNKKFPGKKKKKK